MLGHGDGWREGLFHAGFRDMGWWAESGGSGDLVPRESEVYSRRYQISEDGRRSVAFSTRTFGAVRHLQFEDDGVFYLLFIYFSIKAKWNFVFGLIICSK